MSNISISWHMIVREDYDNLQQCLDSIQGIYDELIIAVDDRPESDKCFDLVNQYPNVKVFRQTWPGRFDYARQEVLNLVNPISDFIGCCDSDEVLVSPRPVEIRNYLVEHNPKSVNLGIKYQFDVGPNLKGQTYLRTKIWSSKFPRKWVGRVHEYPKCIGEYITPIPNYGIVFEHLKANHKAYRSKLIIDTMQKEIKNGIIRWYPYLAQEYRGLENFEEALKCCYTYIGLENPEDNHLKVALDEALFVFGKLRPEEKWKYFLDWILSLMGQFPVLNKNPIICEYVAMGLYYLDKKSVARAWHKRSMEKNNQSQEQQFIIENDRFYN